MKYNIESSMIFKAFCLIIFYLTTTVYALAQESTSKQEDPMQEYFYPPELIMQMQNEIQLKPEQKEKILDIIEEAQKKFNRLNWDLQSAMTAFTGLLAQPAIDEQKALEQLDKVLEQERQVKRTQITLMIKIKNTLTTEQKEKLKTLRKKY